MKYKNFEEWFNTHPGKDKFHYTKEAMRDAWDAALASFFGAKGIVKLNILRKHAVIGQKIHELLTTMKDAMKIDCTCDKIKIKGGAPCICARGSAVMLSTKELGAYLQKLRKELK